MRNATVLRFTKANLVNLCELWQILDRLRDMIWVWYSMVCFMDVYGPFMVLVWPHEFWWENIAHLEAVPHHSRGTSPSAWYPDATSPRHRDPHGWLLNQASRHFQGLWLDPGWCFVVVSSRHMHKFTVCVYIYIYIYTYTHAHIESNIIMYIESYKIIYIERESKMTMYIYIMYIYIYVHTLYMYKTGIRSCSGLRGQLQLSDLCFP